MRSRLIQKQVNAPPQSTEPNRTRVGPVRISLEQPYEKNTEAEQGSQNKQTAKQGEKHHKQIKAPPQAPEEQANDSMKAALEPMGDGAAYCMQDGDCPCGVR